MLPILTGFSAPDAPLRFITLATVGSSARQLREKFSDYRLWSCATRSGNHRRSSPRHSVDESRQFDPRLNRSARQPPGWGHPLGINGLELPLASNGALQANGDPSVALSRPFLAFFA